MAKTTGSRASRERTRFLDGIVSVAEDASGGGSRSRRPKRCRVCSGPLGTPAEKVIGRHEDCEGGGDEEVFAALRSWRSQVARQEKVPAYVIFSDATLQAISEELPSDEAEMLSISGVGPSKLERYGAQVLEVIRSVRS